MAVNKITDADLAGKGVLGQADAPGLSTEEMQKKVEEIVRDVAIVKINELIDWLAENGATQEDLQNLVVEAGSVTSVFGRSGAVKATKGDYTAEQVGAAAERHAENHNANGIDPLDIVGIGAAPNEHMHGNITRDGKIGKVNGKILITGVGGVIEAVEKSAFVTSIVPLLPTYDGEVS